MTLISFNINGIRARLHQLQAVIDKYQPALIGCRKPRFTTRSFPNRRFATWATTPTILARKATMAWH